MNNIADNKRNGTIDFLKFYFAIIIMLFHSFVIAGEEKSIFQGGALAVEFFFLISGYMLAGSVKRQSDRGLGNNLTIDTIKFVLHKFNGFMPNFWLSMILAFCVYIYRHALSFQSALKDLVNSAFNWVLLTGSGLGSASVISLSWYLSVMMITIMVLYPLLRNNYQMVASISFPVFVLVIGYLYHVSGYLTGVMDWMGIAYKSTLRGFGEMLGGIACYEIAEYLKTFNYSRISKSVLTVIEWIMYLASSVYMYNHPSSRMDFLILFMLMVGVIISTSECSYSGNVFNKFRIFSYLGRLSLSIYLCQECLLHLSNDLKGNYNYWQCLVLYVILTISVSIVVDIMSSWIKKHFTEHWCLSPS